LLRLCHIDPLSESFLFKNGSPRSECELRPLRFGFALLAALCFLFACRVNSLARKKIRSLEYFKFSINEKAFLVFSFDYFFCFV
jgi:hypothetical protein